MNLNEIKIALKAVTLTTLMHSVAAQGRDATEAEKKLVNDFAVELKTAEDEGVNTDHTIDDAAHHLLAAIDKLV